MRRHARRAASWLLWTPRRAAAAAAVVVMAGCMGIAYNLPSGPDVPQTATTRLGGQSTAAHAEASQPWYARSPEPSSSATERAQNAQAVDTARAFVRAWLRAHQLDRARWLAGMRAHVEPAVTQFLEATPPSAVPRTTETGGAVVFSTEYAAEVRVKLGDNTWIGVTLAFDGRAWKVTDYTGSGG